MPKNLPALEASYAWVYLDERLRKSIKADRHPTHLVERRHETGMVGRRHPQFVVIVHV